METAVRDSGPGGLAGAGVCRPCRLAGASRGKVTTGSSPTGGKPSRARPSHCPPTPRRTPRLCKDHTSGSQDLRSDTSKSMGRGTRRLPERKLKQLKNVNSPDQKGVSVHTHAHTRPHSRTRPLPLRGRGGWLSSGSPTKATGVTASGQAPHVCPLRDTKSPGACPRRGRAPTLASGQTDWPPRALSPSLQAATTGAAHSPLTRLYLHGQAPSPTDWEPGEMARASTSDRDQPSPLLGASSLRGRTAANRKP